MNGMTNTEMRIAFEVAYNLGGDCNVQQETAIIRVDRVDIFYQVTHH